MFQYPYFSQIYHEGPYSGFHFYILSDWVSWLLIILVIILLIKKILK